MVVVLEGTEVGTELGTEVGTEVGTEDGTVDEEVARGGLVDEDDCGWREEEQLAKMRSNPPSSMKAKQVDLDLDMSELPTYACHRSSVFSNNTRVTDSSTSRPRRPAATAHGSRWKLKSTSDTVDKSGIRFHLVLW